MSSIYFFCVRGFKCILQKNIIKCELFGDDRSALEDVPFCKYFKKGLDGLMTTPKSRQPLDL